MHISDDDITTFGAKIALVGLVGIGVGLPICLLASVPVGLVTAVVSVTLVLLLV
jgi:hypothetical protein